jgi:hypothetical protein
MSSSSEERITELKLRRAIIRKLEEEAKLWGGKLSATQKVAMRKAFYKARAMGYSLPQIRKIVMKAIKH